MLQTYLQQLINSLAELPQVDAIALGGSHSTNTNDSLSDYDLYVYINDMIPVAVREKITLDTCSYMELNNQFWETEDDGILKCGTEIEIIYRSIQWLDNELSNIVLKHRASTGYSSCFWFNLLYSQITYDPNDQLGRLKTKYSQPYPEKLAENIIQKNSPLLTDAMPAYSKQVKKALARNDYYSVHHRVTEYLATDFDVLFAINRLVHPGEKKLIAYCLTRCPRLPEHFDTDIQRMLSMSAHADEKLVDHMNQTSKRLLQLCSN